MLGLLRCALQGTAGKNGENTRHSQWWPIRKNESFCNELIKASNLTLTPD
jgi:hypothetical protein